MTRWEHQDRDDSFNAASAVTLDPGEQATISFTPSGRQSDYYLPILSIGKFPESTYEILIDGSTEYGPAPIPPTDVDDIGDTFRPPEVFRSEVVVKVTNVSTTSTTRTYPMQAIGWERRRYSDEGGY